MDEELTGPTVWGLLAQMEQRGASDLMLVAGHKPAMRIAGEVQELEAPVVAEAALEAVVQRALLPAASAAFAHSGDADASLALEDGRRYRLNLHRNQGRLAIIARAVPSGAVSIEELGLPVALRGWLSQSRGIILVTGATGSGKSTTMAAMVHHINATRAGHILTIEDPIEFVHRPLRSRLTQRELGVDTLSFAAGLRAGLRQAPDIIVLGELRDPETAEVALQAALTGHLVIATMHTAETGQTLQRLLGMLPESQRSQAALDLSTALVGVMAQRLVPRVDRKGRCLAVELLTNTPAIARLLREQRVEEAADMLRSIRSPENFPLTDSLIGLLRIGKVSYDAALAAAIHRDEFALQAKGMATGTATFGGTDERSRGMDMKSLLEAAMARGASDLHLAVGRPPMVRVHGHLQALGSETLSDADLRVLLFSILTGRQRAQYELEREIDFALSVDSGRRFRVNAYYQKGRMAASLRAIPSQAPDPVALGLPEVVLRLGQRPQGLILVVGPTGSGKSTTLAALVDQINRTRPCRIITVEDPIEYVHEGRLATVDQREVGADTRSFSAALRYVLRQDPDVILLGEMRDLEAIQSALTAAETGHLVLATLHANDAIQAVDRVVDVFPPFQQQQVRAQLAACLVGVVSQRLLTRREGDGRVAVFEVLVGTTAVRAQIRDNKTHQCASIMETSRRDGMMTLDWALREAVEQSRISHEEALRFVINPKTLPPPPPQAPSPQAPAANLEPARRWRP